MVKEVGLSEREIEENRRYNKLAEIARQEFPYGNILKADSNYIFMSPNKERYVLQVHLCNNTIYIDVPFLLKDALKLAEAYEKVEPGVEFTVKKKYDESPPSVFLASSCTRY